MNIGHYMKMENSGLSYCTLELVKIEEAQGHSVCLREPSEGTGQPGALLYGQDHGLSDVEAIHHQMPFTSYFTKQPKFLWMHGEPLSSVGNGVSMTAILGLANKVDAFIAMREDELAIWRTIKRTYLVPKGIDLDRFKPIDTKPYDKDDPTSKLEGEPAVIYTENWRGQRNPLYLCAAMEQVWLKYPKARLHLFNVPNERMNGMFKKLIDHNKWWPFIRTLLGRVAEDQMNALYNRADIVVSCLDPLYARSIEAFGAGKPFIGPGYKEHDYPWQCRLHPDSIADAIIQCWENYDKVDYRKYAETYHDVQETVRQSVAIYERYL